MPRTKESRRRNWTSNTGIHNLLAQLFRLLAKNQMYSNGHATDNNDLFNGGEDPYISLFLSLSSVWLCILFFSKLFGHTREPNSSLVEHGKSKRGPTIIGRVYTGAYGSSRTHLPSRCIPRAMCPIESLSCQVCDICCDISMRLLASNDHLFRQL